MAGVTDSQLLDLIRTTKEDLPDGEFELVFDYQVYEVMNRWLRRNRLEIYSGTEILRDIQLDNSGNAAHVNLYQKDTINITNVMHQIKVPWRQARTFWAIERREALRNRKPAAFVKLLNSRRADAHIGMANIVEERGWQAPSSSSDTLNPYGLPYYIVKRADAGEGFNGYNPTGFSTCANIDGSAATGNAMWRNYAAGGAGYYTAVDRTFVKTMKKAYLKINFQAPFTVQDLVKGPRAQYRIYTNCDAQIAYEDLAEKQNENLGRDLAPFQGLTAFRRAPIVYIPYLDNDSEDPFYMVNHSKFQAFVQDGDYLRESDPIIDVEYHNVPVVFVDLSYNFLCLNRRLQAVVHK